MRRSSLQFLISFCLVVFLAIPGRTQEVRIQAGDPYIIELLKLALAADQSGYKVSGIQIPYIRQDRAFRQLDAKTPPFEVVYSAWSPERERSYRMIHFPLTRGLLGKRILAVKPGDRDLLKNISNIDELRQVKIGSGRSWPDTEYLLAAGLDVVETDAENMWRMLFGGRFQALHRGLNEAFHEVKRINNSVAGELYVLDEHLILSYRQDLFFYVSDKNEALAIAIENGLEILFESGQYEEWFNRLEWSRSAMQSYKDPDRQIFHLPSPYLDANLSSVPEKYWVPEN